MSETAALCTKTFNALTAGFQAATAGRVGDDRVVQWVCGDDTRAKHEVMSLVDEIGYFAIDVDGHEPSTPFVHGARCQGTVGDGTAGWPTSSSTISSTWMSEPDVAASSRRPGLRGLQTVDSAIFTAMITAIPMPMINETRWTGHPFVGRIIVARVAPTMML